jgi:hypothetical protein
MICCPKHAFSQLTDCLAVVARLGNVDHSFVAGNSAKAAKATANFHQHGTIWLGRDVLLSLEGVPDKLWGRHYFTSELLKTACMFGRAKVRKVYDRGAPGRTVGSNYFYHRATTVNGLYSQIRKFINKNTFVNREYFGILRNSTRNTKVEIL